MFLHKIICIYAVGTWKQHFLIRFRILRGRRGQNSGNYSSFSNIQILYILGAILPLLSSDAERVFSKLNLIKSLVRNQLLLPHVKIILIINM